MIGAYQYVIHLYTDLDVVDSRHCFERLCAVPPHTGSPYRFITTYTTSDLKLDARARKLS